MDPQSACRVAIRVADYVEQRMDGKDDYHVTSDIVRVFNKDTLCWMDLQEMLNDEIVHGQDQVLCATFFDKNQKKYVVLDSDSVLLGAFDMYWDIRRLPIQVHVKDTGPRLLDLSSKASQVSSVVSTQQSQVAQVDNVDPVPNTEPNNCTESDNGTDTDSDFDTDRDPYSVTDSDSDSDNDTETETQPKAKTKDPKATKPIGKKAFDKDDWGESAETEYVGVDDEKSKYKDLMSDDEVEDPDYYPESDGDDNDPLTLDDEKGCESVMHITDIDNPKIEEGVTFEDGFCFKRCIRQYAVLKEVELAVPYSESTRYRAYCKAKRCRWSIYASQLQDGRTWMVCNFVLSYTCIQLCHTYVCPCYNAFCLIHCR